MATSGSVISAGGIVLREQTVLIVGVKDGKGRTVWTFPKGRLNEGERSSDAALREVEEETGWRCRITGRLAESHYWFHRDGRRVKKTVQWFSMSPLSETGAPDGEVDEIRWVRIPDALIQLNYASDRELLHRAVRQRGANL